MLKQSCSEFSTSQSQSESDFLNQSDSLFTSMFDDLNSQFSFEFTSKLKLRMITQSADSADQQGESHTFNDQHILKSQLIDVNKQIELIKLRVQALQLELQIKRLIVSLNFSSNSSSQSSTFSVQFVWFDDRVNDYRKEVTSKNSRLTFKLEESQNYDVWQEEVFVKILTIHMKHILSNKKLICSADLTDDDDKRIW